MSVETDALRFRAALLSRDANTLYRLSESYKPVAATLKLALVAVQAIIDTARANGEPISRGWLARQERFAELLVQVEAELTRFAATATGETTTAQAAAAQSGTDAARQLTIAGLDTDAERATVGASWNRLPTGAINELVGVMGDGSTAGEYLRGIVGETLPALRDVILRGVALGKSPRTIAREAEAVTGVTRTRALRIARTETMRAYRAATIQTYAENADVVKAWRWLASLSGRTCPACLAMHGRMFPVTEAFGSHVGCRCVAAPVIENRLAVPFESGEQWLRRQEPETVARVFDGVSSEARARWEAGAVVLADFVNERDDPKWGKVRVTRSAI
ncbi:MAG: minor capsid protein [Armatimonadetes bacterium]|nr:minor capsid protein [Armatimonadota bacterium]